MNDELISAAYERALKFMSESKFSVAFDEDFASVFLGTKVRSLVSDGECDSAVLANKAISALRERLQMMESASRVARTDL
jgi:hypothetical protein